MKIRNGYVSNSSSSSFVVIKKGDIKYPELKPGFELDGEYEFGWGPERHYDVNSKINWAWIQSEYSPKHRDQLLEILTKCGLPKDYEFSLTTDWDKKEKTHAYIDHQSMGELECFDDLEQFLFCRDSFIMEDNDNH